MDGLDGRDLSDGSFRGEADAIFDLIDLNGDGAIDLRELSAHLSGQGYARAAVQSLFALLDGETHPPCHVVLRAV